MAVPTCQRCGGQVLGNYGEQSCLQCGWDPDQNGAPIKADVETKAGPKKKRKSKSELPVRQLSAKPSQIRRRKRRLLAKGYTERQADRIIAKQIGSRTRKKRSQSA